MIHYTKAALLVISCDKFNGLWDIHFNRLEKFWPDCQLKIYLLTNHINFDRENVQTIDVGDDIDWSSNLKRALDNINEDYVLTFLEDGILNEIVDNNKFQYYLDEFVKLDMNYLCLKDYPKPTKISDEKQYGIIHNNVNYRCSIAFSLWKTKFLRKMLFKNESAWEFEINGTARSRNIDNFYSSDNEFFKADHVIVKGYIQRSIYKKLKSTNELDKIHSFELMPLNIHLKELIIILRGKILKLFPIKFQTKIRNIFYKYIFKENFK